MDLQSSYRKPYLAKMGVGLVGSPRQIVSGDPAGTLSIALTMQLPALSKVTSTLGLLA